MSTYPTYRSPIRTLQELGISAENLDASQLRFERKRLLLEIQISDSQTTKIGTKEFGKNDIIELFDELEGISDLEFHQQIFIHPALLQLLENQAVSRTIKDEKTIWFETPEKQADFKRFISPYLAYSIDKLLTRVIRNHEYIELTKIQSCFTFLEPTDAFFAFRKFNNFCETLSDRLESLTVGQAVFPSDEVTFLRFAPFYDAVNLLTIHYPVIADHVASAIINFTVYHERTPRRGKQLVQISDQAIRLHCSAKLKSLLVGNRAAFHSSREGAPDSSSYSTWRIIVGVLVVISMMFRYSNSCESKNRYGLDNDNTELMRQLREMDVNLPSGVYTPADPSTNHINESSFLALHAKIQQSVTSELFDQNFYLTDSVPEIISSFGNQDSTDISMRTAKNYSLVNATNSELLMIIWEGNNLNSYYIPALDKKTIKLKDHSCIFFYAGRKWNTARHIHHMHRSPKNSIISIIRTGGYFEKTNEKEREFLRKFFSLTDGFSVEFVVKEEDGEYEFYQGNRHVNYSY